jgi:glycosyltransferase involved in cell wall biosynthesis
LESKQNVKNPKISIGLPIYNGEKFLRKRIENLLSQTFTDFELIISDNASTDNSIGICKEYMNKDSRIKLYEQDHNIGQFNNYNFLLEKIVGEFFLWVAVDDLLLPEFLEKNLHILETNQNVVTSISKVKMFGDFTNSIKEDQNDSIKQRIVKKIKIKISHMDCFPVAGEYDNKINDFLKNCRHSQVFYGIHRTNAIKKCVIREPFLGQDTFYALSLLRYGDIHVIEDKLMEIFDGGDSRAGDMIKISKMTSNKWYRVIFPWISMTINCKKQIGLKLFLKNINFFIKLNFSGLCSLIITIFRRLRQS